MICALRFATDTGSAQAAPIRGTPSRAVGFISISFRFPPIPSASSSRECSFSSSQSLCACFSASSLSSPHLPPVHLQIIHRRVGVSRRQRRSSHVIGLGSNFAGDRARSPLPATGLTTLGSNHPAAMLSSRACDNRWPSQLSQTRFVEKVYRSALDPGRGFRHLICRALGPLGVLRRKSPARGGIASGLSLAFGMILGF